MAASYEMAARVQAPSAAPSLAAPGLDLCGTCYRRYFARLQRTMAENHTAGSYNPCENGSRINVLNPMVMQLLFWA